MALIKGYARRGAGVVSTDASQLEAIKQKRAAKKAQDGMAGEIGHLRGLVLDLIKRVEELERRV